MTGVTTIKKNEKLVREHVFLHKVNLRVVQNIYSFLTIY